MKKFSAFIICLLLVLTCCLSGCAGFSINKVKYYNEVVAKVGNTNITRHELIVAYNNYGKNYYETQQGNSTKKAMAETLNSLANRELLYQYALANEDKYGLKAYQVNDAIDSMFQSIDDQMEEYVASAKRMLNIKAEAETDKTTDSEEKAYTLQDYYYKNKRRATVELQNGVSRIVYNLDKSYDKEFIVEENVLNNYKNEEIYSEIITAYFKKFKDSLNYLTSDQANSVYSTARALLATDLISYEKYLRDEKGNAYNVKTEDLIYRYFKRTFDSQIKSQYLSNIRTYYLEHETLSISNLINYFNSSYKANRNTYANDIEGYLEAMADAGTKADDIMYHPATDTTFGYFIHVLFSFSENQKTAIKNLEANASMYGGKNSATYKAKYEDIVFRAIVDENVVDPENPNPEMMVDSRDYLDTGLVTGQEKLSDVIDYYNDYVVGSDPDNYDYDVRLEHFINFMFQYTGDASSTLVSGMPYVVGNNGHSKMEANFTDEALSLMGVSQDGGIATGKPGAVSKFSLNSDELCITSYGIHLLFYVGEVGKSDIPYSAVDAGQVYIEANNKIDANGNVVGYNLAEKVLNPLTGETYFDRLFDKVYPAGSGEETYTSNTGYSEEENRLIAENQNKYPITIYTTKLKGTKASL